MEGITHNLMDAKIPGTICTELIGQRGAACEQTRVGRPGLVSGLPLDNKRSISEGSNLHTRVGYGRTCHDFLPKRVENHKDGAFYDNEGKRGLAGNRSLTQPTPPNGDIYLKAGDLGADIGGRLEGRTPKELRVWGLGLSPAGSGLTSSAQMHTGRKHIGPNPNTKNRGSLLKKKNPKVGNRACLVLGAHSTHQV